MSEMIHWEKLNAEQRNMLIDKKVMGIEQRPLCPGLEYGSISWDHGIWRCGECGFSGTRHNPVEHHQPVSAYTQNMTDAWKVVEMITRIPQTYEESERMGSTRFMIWWEKQNLWAETAIEAAESICKAALQCKGYEVIDER
jgi:hypothetical protein